MKILLFLSLSFFFNVVLRVILVFQMGKENKTKTNRVTSLKGTSESNKKKNEV